LEISKIFIKKSYKVIVFTEQFDTRLKLKDSIQSIEIYRIPVGKENFLKKFRIWSQLWEYRGLIRKADIIHCHDVFFWYLPFRFLYPKKPVYTTFHGYEGNNLPSKKAIFMHKLAEKLSNGNICVGDYLKKWYGTKLDYVTYGAVEISNFIQSAGSRQILNKKKKTSAVFIGRLDEQTGISTYVDAVKLIRKKVSDFNFVVIGDGKFKKEIQKEVRTLGWIKNPESFFQKYHFAFVSRYLSILEAMASRRLVFAVYDNPIKEDYLRLSPFAKFINILSSKEELSSLVFYFLDHPNKEKAMVYKAFDWVKIQSWDKVSQLYINLWREK